jgi:glutathione S-transferase
MPEAAKALHRQNLERRLTHIDHHLSRQPYLVGDSFTVADAYLFVMLGWEPYFKLDPTPYRSLLAFHARVLARPSIARMRELVAPLVGQLALPEFPRVALPAR